ncbi:MAG TPA: NAD(P)H-hydrate epimerase [Candidatus Dormibacteraeota bacterium]|nr:NAD(P)H-hydrate epimerase [Candidatus Dormibacteraeota bacterium]
MDKLTSWRLGLTPDQMREVDRLAEADYGIAPIQLMEIAGLQTARVAREILGPDIGGRAVCILAGKGNNGGDGLVAARRLAGWGVDVRVSTSFAARDAHGLGAQGLAALRREEVEVKEWAGRLPVADLYIDALLGFGAAGPPRGAIADMIEALGAGNKVLALDVPSGLDATTGEVAGACVRAAATVTLGLPKTGLLTAAAAGFVGILYVADIGVPRRLLLGMGVDTTGLFSSDDIIRL